MRDVIIKDYKMDRAIEYTNVSGKMAMVTVWNGWRINHNESFYNTRWKAKRYFRKLRKKYNI